MPSSMHCQSGCVKCPPLLLCTHKLILFCYLIKIHHVPSLFLHPSRRIRSLAVAIHGTLLKLPSPAPESLLASLAESSDQDYTECVFAAWCMAAFDIDRQVATSARDSWTTSTAVVASEGITNPRKMTLGEHSLHRLWDLLVRRVLVDPSSMWAYVNPPPPPPPPPPPSAPRKGGARNNQPIVNKRAATEDDAPERVKGDEEEENEEDRWARMRVGAFGAAEWVFRAYAASSEVVQW
jgi:E3 ubiquitin-protein ligase listerin